MLSIKNFKAFPTINFCFQIVIERFFLRFNFSQTFFVVFRLHFLEKNLKVFIRDTKKRYVLIIKRYRKSFINLSHGFTANQIDPLLFMSHGFSKEQPYWPINKNYLLSVIFHDKCYIIYLSYDS